MGKITSYQTAEYGKFEEIVGSSSYPPVSVIRWSYPDTTNAFPSNSGLPPVSSVDIYYKYAILAKLINPEDIKISLSAENINVDLDQIELNTDEVEGLIRDSNAELSAVRIDMNYQFDETQTILLTLTSIQNDKQDKIITLLDTLTANTDSLEVNTDEVEMLIKASNTKLDVLTGVDYSTSSKQDSIITLLDVLTANTDSLEVNTDEVEALIRISNTKLDVLTGVDYSTSSKQDSIITLLDVLTANTDSLEVNTDEVEMLIKTSNTKLDVLTGVDYSTETKQNSIITLLSVLTANTDSLEINTDEVEGLIKTSNTKLDVLTGVDYSTSSKQDSIISAIQSLSSVNRINGFVIPDYNRIKNYYYGTSNNLSQVDYKMNTTVVASLSFTYVGDSSIDGALISEVIKL